MSLSLRYGHAGLAVALLALVAASQEQIYRRDLEALTAAEMAGRGVGSVGGERAIRYLVDAMNRIGLRPGCGGSFRQDFEVDDPAPASYRSGTAIATTSGGRERALMLGSDAVPFRFSADGEVDAEVVFAGYGLTIPEMKINDYAGLDVAGKVVLVLRGAPRWRQPGSAYRAHRQQLRFVTKASRAAAAGAAALLLCDRADESGRPRDVDLTNALRVPGEVGIPAWWISRNAAAALFRSGEDGLQARQRVLDQRPAGENPCSGLVPGSRARLTVAMGPRTPRLSTSNVIGLLPGRDPEACGQFIVVGAHHDHLGRGGYASLASAGEAHRVHPGADDNASGLAGLLELTRRLRAGPALRRSVLLVGFGAEEFGQLGSREFLDCGPIAPPAIVAMVNLDQIGRAESRTPRVYGVGSGIGLEALVEAAARGRGVEAQLHAWSSPRSDHYRFLRQEIPALLFHTGLHDQYHRPSDVPGLVEIKGALRVVDLAERVIRDLAEADVAPAFQRPKEGR